MYDDDEDSGAPLPFPIEIQEIENETEFNRSGGESLYTMVHVPQEDEEAPSRHDMHSVLIARTGQKNEKVTVNLRFTYTQDSVLATPPGRHLPYRCAEQLVGEIVDSWLADQANVGHNLTEEQFETNLANALENIGARIRSIQGGNRNLPLLGMQVGKRSSRRESPSYTMVPVARKDSTETPTLKPLFEATGDCKSISFACGAAAQRNIVNNNPNTYFQKNTTVFSAAAVASVSRAPEGTYATGDRYNIKHTVHVEGAPPPPVPATPSEAVGIVGGSSDTDVLLEEAAVASESLAEASEDWDLTLS